MRPIKYPNASHAYQTQALRRAFYRGADTLLGQGYAPLYRPLAYARVGRHLLKVHRRTL